MQTLFSNHWMTKIRNEAKMRTYLLFKSHFRHEEYFSINHPGLRQALCKLRISAHNLTIEKGRYTRPFTPAELRVCNTCPDKLDDEIHFLTECTKYSTDRIELFEQIAEICPNFINLTQLEKFIYLLSVESDAATLVARFVHQNLP